MYGTDMHTGTSTSTVVHTVRAGAAGHVRDFPGISRVGLPVAVWPEDDASPPAGLSSLQWHDGVAQGTGSPLACLAGSPSALPLSCFHQGRPEGSACASTASSQGVVFTSRSSRYSNLSSALVLRDLYFLEVNRLEEARPKVETARV